MLIMLESWKQFVGMVVQTVSEGFVAACCINQAVFVLEAASVCWSR